ncbi:unnamed protein product [Prunus armeniaca]
MDQGQGLVDRISELEDGILGRVVSRLLLKQAVATSVLSKRWRYVWSHTRTLNFHEAYRFPEEPLEPEKRKEKYVKFVDHVLKHHTGGHVDYFLALFDVEKDKSTNTTVSKWLEFAEKAKAQTVTLIMLVEGLYSGSMDLAYESAHTFMGKYEMKECDGLTDIAHPCKYMGFKFLKSIHLIAITTMGEALNCLLVNCVCLQEVSLHYCRGFRDDRLRVVGPSKQLMHLKIVNCSAKALDINHPNLVSFSYDGDYKTSFLWNAPLLAEVSLKYTSAVSHFVVFSDLCSCHLHMEVLKLNSTLFYGNHGITKLANLKHLEVKIAADEDCCVLLLASFIEASPKLQKLVLELTGILRPQPKIEIKEAPKFSHGSLKVVEVKNYRGRPGDLKLVMYLIDHPLEQINSEEMREVSFMYRARDEMGRKVPKQIELTLFLFLTGCFWPSQDDRNNFRFDRPVYV